VVLVFWVLAGACQRHGVGLGCFFLRNATITENHGLLFRPMGLGAFFSERNQSAITKKEIGRKPAHTATARDLRYFSVDAGTSQHKMARHDRSRVACVGWRSSDLPTAIAPRHPIRVARLGSWHNKARRAKPSARVPKVAR